MTLVSVSGLDGSGKTVFAGRLARACEQRGVHASVLAIDDFRRAVSWDQPRRSETDIYYEDYFDLEALGRALAGAAPADAVIVEGVLALRAPALREAFAIYLDVAEDVARERLVARDTARGRTPGEVRRRIEQRYFPAQQRYLASHDPRGRAHVLVDNNDPERPRLVRGTPAEWPASLRAPLLDLLGDP